MREAYFVIAAVFLLSVLVVWVLYVISGSAETSIKASLKIHGAQVHMTGMGLFGAFLAVALLGLAAIYAFSR